MRRLLPLVAAVAVLASASGCGPSGGSPGGRGVRAAPSALAAFATPRAGVCHAEVRATSYPLANPPLDCAGPHKAEAVHVGAFTGRHADASRPPVPNSTGARAAYAGCDPEATRFVGGDWRGGRLGLQVVAPSPEAWTAGARWYRCDIFEKAAVDTDERPVRREGTLRGALTRGLPLVYTCFNEDDDEALVPVACRKRHRFEYVGVWTAPDIRRDRVAEDSDRLYRRCAEKVGVFLGVPKSVDMTRQTGAAWRMPSPVAWDEGDRGVRCFLWSGEGRTLTKSLKGAGRDALPIG